MRIWSLHPQYLDRQGLVACWRESLLAQAVLTGRTRGYRQHSQLVRFRETADPAGAIGAYLRGIATEATTRGYRFDSTRIECPEAEVPTVAVTTGQIDREWAHLMTKLAHRSPERHAAIRQTTEVVTHPLFTKVPGPPASWERATPSQH